MHIEPSYIGMAFTGLAAIGGVIWQWHRWQAAVEQIPRIEDRMGRIEERVLELERHEHSDNRPARSHSHDARD